MSRIVGNKVIGHHILYPVEAAYESRIAWRLTLLEKTQQNHLRLRFPRFARMIGTEFFRLAFPTAVKSRQKKPIHKGGATHLNLSEGLMQAISSILTLRLSSLSGFRSISIFGSLMLVGNAPRN